MKALVYGAGVIGSLYAARLRQAGHDVAILARGQRLADLRAHQLVLEHAVTGARLAATIKTAEALAPEDQYDLVLVPVRRDQLQSVLEPLAAARSTPNVLFFCNTAAGPNELVSALGRERVLLGFPGAGGTRIGAVVRYLLIRQQATTMGELDGTMTPRLRRFRAAFEGAGFRTAISRHMDGWLKYHAVFVCSICGAIYRAGGRASRLADRPDILQLMVQATGEGFRALRGQGITGAPGNLRMLYEVVPQWFAVRYWQRAMRTALGEFSFAAHANAGARGAHPARAASEGPDRAVGPADASDGPSVPLRGWMTTSTHHREWRSQFKEYLGKKRIEYTRVPVSHRAADSGRGGSLPLGRLCGTRDARVTGVANLGLKGYGWREVRDESAWQGWFGHTLAGKLILVAAIVVISGAHDFVLEPRFTRPAGEHPDLSAARRLRRQAAWIGRIVPLLSIVVVVLGVILVRGV